MDDNRIDKDKINIFEDRIDNQQRTPDIGEDGIIEGNYIDITDMKSKNNLDFQTNGEKSSYYSETILNDSKNTGKSSSFKKIVAGILIASIVGGSMMGVGMGIARPIAENLIASKSEQAQIKESAFAFNGNESSNNNIVEIDTDIETTNVSPASAIAKNVGPSVVGITNTFSIVDFFDRVYDNESSGSGIIFDSTDDRVYIVTNNHVIESNNPQTQSIVITFLGDQKLEADIVGTDSETDLAVLSVEKSGMSQDTLNRIRVAKFGDSSQLQVGELAVAIGNPLGERFSNSVTQGIISGLDRKISTTDKEFTVIQTDAAINNGNSGGALVNSKGEVIGINTLKVKTSGVEGMGFAIPTNIAKPVIEELRNKGYISRPYLGIIMNGTVTEQLSQIWGLPVGVMIADVNTGSAAAKAGLQAGDIITEFDGEKITSTDQLSQIIKSHKVGDKITIKFVRSGKTQLETVVELQDSGRKSEQTATPQSQNGSQDYEYGYTFPFEIWGN